MIRQVALVSLALLLLPSLLRGQAPQPELCRPVPGLEELLQPGSVLLLGEMHGTVESPSFGANVVCLALRAGRSVSVALEIPRDETPRLEAFLASAGSATDRIALLVGRFWQPAARDGRSSEALLALLDDVRRLERSGQAVRVYAIDRYVKQTPQERDHAMAEKLKEVVAAAPQGVLVVLAGNVHARVTRGVPWNADYEPMGFLFKQMAPGRRVTALDVGFTTGTAWICLQQDSCKPQALHGPGDQQGMRVVLRQGVEGFDGLYNVESLNASPPVVKAPEESQGSGTKDTPGPANNW